MRYFNLIKNLSNWWLYLAIKFGIYNADPVLFRTRNGMLVEVPQRLLQTFKEIFMDECYMDGLELHIPNNSTIIDIGANAGFFTLFAAFRFNDSRILAYEPVLSNFKQLARNRGLNTNCSIECFQKAVAGHSGTVEIMFDGIIYNCPLECLSRIDQIAMVVHGGTESRQNIDSLEAYLNEQGFTTRRRPVGMLWAWKK